MVMIYEDDIKKQFVSKLVINNRLYEEIYDPDTNKASFVYYDAKNGSLKTNEYVSFNGIKYFPIIDDFIKKEVVILPTEAEEYESEKTLISNIQQYIRKNLDINTDDEILCSLTIPIYWLFDRLDMMIPYLRALGDTGCGKSRFLNVLGGISYRPLMVGGSITPAILYRVAELWKGTLIIDEADWKFTDEYNEIMKIINCNQPNRRILRCKGNDYDKIQVFDPFCPRIFATRHEFKDIATESRMFTIKMKETSRKDIPIILDDSFIEEQKKLRNQLLTYRLKNFFKVNKQEKPIIDLNGIEPRSKQIMYPLLVLFNNNKEMIQVIKSIINKRQIELIKDRIETFDGEIINIFIKLYESGKNDITSRDILLEMIFRGYKYLTTQKIGRRLKSFGLENIIKNINGKTKRCYYCDSDLFEKLKRRYTISDKIKKI
jgi:hypothetical protein